MVLGIIIPTLIIKCKSDDNWNNSKDFVISGWFEPTNQRLINHKHQQERNREDGSNNEDKEMNRQIEKAKKKRKKGKEKIDNWRFSQQTIVLCDLNH